MRIAKPRLQQLRGLLADVVVLVMELSPEAHGFIGPMFCLVVVAGFRSRCTMKLRWAISTAAITSRNTSSLRRMVQSAAGAAIGSPSTYSMTGRACRLRADFRPATGQCWDA